MKIIESRGDGKKSKGIGSSNAKPIFLLNIFAIILNFHFLLKKSKKENNCKETE